MGKQNLRENQSKRLIIVSSENMCSHDEVLANLLTSTNSYLQLILILYYIPAMIHQHSLCHLKVISWV